MDYTFRKLTSDDFSLALAMNAMFREGFFTPDGAAAFLRDDRNWLFAALRDNAVIGFAYGYELLRPDSSKMLYIHEVGIAEPFQRQGVGTALIAALKMACREHGIRRFFLFTAKSNAGANALYRKADGETGWESHGDDTAYFFNLLP